MLYTEDFIRVQDGTPYIYTRSSGFLNHPRVGVTTSKQLEAIEGVIVDPKPTVLSSFDEPILIAFTVKTKLSPVDKLPGMQLMFVRPRFAHFTGEDRIILWTDEEDPDMSGERIFFTPDSPLLDKDYNLLPCTGAQEVIS
jgi:hypothetical protein